MDLKTSTGDWQALDTLAEVYCLTAQIPELAAP
jgi:hypothetical protein